MANFTSNTYQMKREILAFSNKISKKLSKPDKKFTANMTFGILASGSCLLTDIVDRLHEKSQKVNSVERLTRHLNKGIPVAAQKSYLTSIRKWVSSEPVIHIDDIDVVKPDSYKFEVLGIVRDGSKSSNTKSVYEKGYHVTEACVLTKKHMMSCKVDNFNLFLVAMRWLPSSYFHTFSSTYNHFLSLKIVFIPLMSRNILLFQ